MKWEIIHRTSFAYASPVRDSFNEARLQPFSDEWQTVENFLLKVLRRPAAASSRFLFQRRPPFRDHRAAQFAARGKPPPRDDQTASAAVRHGNALAAGPHRRGGGESRVFDFLQESRFVELSPEVWRLALDMTDGVADTWQRRWR